ncbi:MAG: GNAT family N-acetyltransferase [Saprospiraceae bacterium]|nr:GNAT family N-acetyltransferase [Saprospiraceae bacterium]
MENINIRKATLHDLPFIHELVRELAIYEKAEQEFIATLDDYERDMQAGIFEAIVAEKEQETLGMVLYYMAYSTWKGRMMYLEDFVVKQAYRQHGLGQLLFNAFIEESKQKGCRLAKWQVLDWNAPAIRFYEKNNAIIEKEWWNGKLFF